MQLHKLHHTGFLVVLRKYSPEICILYIRQTSDYHGQTAEFIKELVVIIKLVLQRC